MEKIRIKGTEDTPNIILDKDEGIFEFSGKSLPEDVIVFYGPILKWLEEYKKSPNAKTVVVFKFAYFNTASSKVIMDILQHFEDINFSGKEVLIKWCYHEEDDDMKDAGKEYADMISVAFENITY